MTVAYSILFVPKRREDKIPPSQWHSFVTVLVAVTVTMTGDLNTVINEVVVSVVGGSVSVIVLGGRVSVVVAHAAWRGVRGFACPSRESRERSRRYKKCIVRIYWVIESLQEVSLGPKERLCDFGLVDGGIQVTQAALYRQFDTGLDWLFLPWLLRNSDQY